MSDRTGGIYLVTIAILAIILVVIAFRWLARRRRLALERERHMPIPLVSFAPANEPPVPPASQPRRRSEERRTGDHTPPRAAAAPRDELVAAESMRFAPPVSHPGATAPLADRRATDEFPRVRDFGQDAIRFQIPVDRTLQFLPGRFEVLDGTDEGHEIRFVRDSDAECTIVTFGRSDGPPYKHVQIHRPTVSRTHARVTIDGSTWLLTNLSATNPVNINGRPLSGVESSVVLRDGDRIEMGEVVFCFRER